MWASCIVADRLTVIIVAVAGGEALRACRDKVRAQTTRHLVVYPDGTIVADSEKPIGLAEHCNIPFKRKTAIALAASPLVALIEDTVIPRSGWARAVEAAFENPAVVGCGGPVSISTHLPASSSALALSEFGMFNDRKRPGQTSALPGCNFAFRREAVLNAAGSEGLVDQIIFQRLQGAGGRLEWMPDMRVDFRHADRNGARLATRFHHGRIYASFERKGGLLDRVGIAAKAVLLPPVLTTRTLRHACLQHLSLPTLGWLALQHAAWAAGEFSGAVFGASKKGMNQWR